MDRPTVPDVLPLMQQIYERHSGGCCLHIVTDDRNVQDGHVMFCLEQARARQHADCIEAAEKLLSMSRTQRLKVAAKC